MKKSIILLIIGIIFLIKIFSQDTNYKSEPTSIPIDYIVAEVGGRIVLLSDIESMAMQMKLQGYSINDETKCTIFNDLINAKILLHQAELDSIVVGDDRIAREVEYRVDYFKQKLGSTEKLEEYFRKPEKEIYKSLSENLKEQLTTQQMQQKITEIVEVTLPEIKQFFSLMEEETLPMVGQKYKYAQITREIPSDNEEIERIKNLLNNIRERILKDESFSGLAVLYSECPSAPKGGELGYTNRSTLDPEFAGAAFKLKKGEISKIVKSQFGYHIIQMIDRKGERINVRHILMKPKISDSKLEKESKMLDSLKIKLEANKFSFSEVAQYASYDEDTRANGGIVINQTNGSSVFTETELPDKDKDIVKKLKVGEISDPFLSEDSKKNNVLKIIKVFDIIPAHKLNFKDDYQAVKDQASERKKEKELEKWLKNKIKSTYIRIDEKHQNCPFLREKRLIE